MTDFQMAFAGGPFDHAETRRDTATIQKLVDSKKAQAVLLHKGNPALDADGKLLRVHPSRLKGKNLFDPGPIYLGQDGDIPLFAASMADEADNGGGTFSDMRFAAGAMQPVDLAIAGRARALLDWHFNHQFCAKCGKKSDAREGGIKRLCTFCNTEHFPRVNPVVIMLVLHDDQCLLGRGASWPEGAYSALAGFVSPGETLEEATRREVWEETGVMTDKHRYVFSQPWPFPAQLMAGMICEARDTALTINKAEIETANWFSKETVRGVFAKTDDAFLCPPRFTIAHQLLKWWISQD